MLFWPGGGPSTKFVTPAKTIVGSLDSPHVRGSGKSSNPCSDPYLRSTVSTRQRQHIHQGVLPAFSAPTFATS